MIPFVGKALGAIVSGNNDRHHDDYRPSIKALKKRIKIVENVQRNQNMFLAMVLFVGKALEQQRVENIQQERNKSLKTSLILLGIAGCAVVLILMVLKPYHDDPSISVLKERIETLEDVQQEQMKSLENIQLKRMSLNERIKTLEDDQQERMKSLENVQQEQMKLKERIKTLEDIQQEQIKSLENVQQERMRLLKIVQYAQMKSDENTQSVRTMLTFVVVFVVLIASLYVIIS